MCLVLSWWFPGLLLGPGLARAMPPEVSVADLPSRLSLVPWSEVLKEPDRPLSLDAARQSPGWSPGQGRALNWGISNTAWWLRVRLRNPADPPREVVLDTGSAQQDTIDWYVWDPDHGPVDQGRMGDRLPFALRRLDTRTLAVPVTVPPGGTRDVYLRCDSHDGLHDMLPLTLATARDFARQVRAEDLLLTLFHGGMLLLAGLSLVLLFAFQDRTLLFYCLYLGSFATYSAVAGGFDAMYLWPDSPRWHNALALLAGMGSLVGGNAFAISLLRSWQHLPPWLWRASRLLLLGCLAGLLPLFWDHYLLTFLATFFGLVLTLVTFGSTLWLARRGVRDARPIAIGFSALIAGVCLFYLDLLGAIPSGGLATAGLRIGACLQVLLFSLALAFSLRRLETEKIQAQDASRAKAAFLATMSHEIRTPLGAMLGFARLGLAQTDDPRQRDRMEQIVRAGQHLLGIINDILDFSKIDGGHLRLERIPFSPRALLDDIRAMLADKAAEKGLALVTTTDPALPEVLLGDPLRLSQILLNYANNAIKFSDTGTVALRLRPDRAARHQPCLHGEVEDAGIGLDPDQVAQLFTPFHQADASYSRRFGGTGLGLAICRSLAELMGGTVGVRSHKGKGSLFWFRVQMAPAPPGTRPLPTRLAAQTPPVLETPAGRRVLLVDDNEGNRLCLRDLLESSGLRVEEAADGLQAVDRLTTAPDGTFDLVLMDMMMPRCDGLEATRRLRRDPRFRDLPIVAMTANASAADARLCAQAGMWGHLAKPVDEPALWRTLSRFLSGRAAPCPPEVLDADLLEQVRGQASPERFERLLRLLVADCENGGREVVRLAGEGDVKALRTALHDLVGSAGNAGLPRLTALCQALGRDLRAGRARDLPARAADIAAATRESARQLRERFLGPDPGTPSGTDRRDD